MSIFNSLLTLRAFLILAFTLVFLAGCGSDSDDPGIQEPEPDPINPEPPEPPFSDAVLSVLIEMHEDDLNELYSRSIWSDDRLPALVYLDDSEEALPVEMRFRGSSTRQEPKKGYNIRFDDGDQDFLWGGDRINARAMWRDPSFVREHLSMWLFREYDLPAPRTRYFELFINDVFEGFYMHVERIDRRFSRARDLNRDATLVRDEFRTTTGNDCGVGANQHTAFADNNWSAMTYEEALACIQGKFDDRRVDWETVLDFILWVDGSQPGETFAQELEERVDVESMTRFFGVHALVGDRDSLWGNDYWWFKDHEDPDAKWLFIPWDKNLSFGSQWRGEDSDLPYGAGNLYFPYEYRLDNLLGQNRLFRYYLETPSLRNQLETWLAEQIDSPTYLADLDAELATQLEVTTDFGRVSGLYENEFARNAENHMNLHGTYAEHVQQVTEFRDLRRNYLRQKLTAGLSGPRHQVDMTLQAAHPAGEVLWLVDGWGFTLGRLVPDDELPAGTELRLQALDGSEDNPINKDWQFFSSEHLQGYLSVYYRNDAQRPGTAPPETDWYTGTGSIGNQPHIELYTQTEGMTLEDLVARPLINRLDARINYAVTGSGEALLTTRFADSLETTNETD